MPWLPPALREQMIRLETGRTDVLDTCGIGGDGTGTFNISTAAAFLAAAAGVTIVKHGNRAVSSRSGSADVLAALGLVLQEDVRWAQRCLEQDRLGFLLRTALPSRFTACGTDSPPATSPDPVQLPGTVGEPGRGGLSAARRLSSRITRSLGRCPGALGSRHAFLVCGKDGLDEVSLSGPTLVREVRGSTVSAAEWSPHDFGLAPVSLSELLVSGPEESAAVIRGILEGEEGPAARVAIANAAAALLAAEQVETLPEGVARAREAIQTGRARQVLERLLTC